MSTLSRLGKQIEEIVAALNGVVRFALIGGLALASHKVIRATRDIDLLTDVKNADEIDELLTHLGYRCIHRSADAIVIQVTLNEGRAQELKRAFYKSVADGLHERVGLRREDVFISLVEVKRENWSFGNGEAQYA